MGHIRYDIAPIGGNEAIELLYATSSSYDHGWHSIVHTHPNAEIFYCVAGEGRFRVGVEDFAVRADDLIIVNPHEEHTEYSLEKTHLEYIVLGVKGVEFTAPDGQRVTYRVMNYTQNRRELLPCFRDIIAEASQKKEQSDEVCHYLLQVLLIRLKRHEAFDVEYSTPAWFASAECLHLKDFIDNHYNEDLDLDTLVAQTHLSKYYLAHLFQKEFGESPVNYLMQRRIREARYLLTNTDHRLSEISRILGFSSQSYFSQCFRRITGQAPREYRRSTRAEK